ncbi:AMP dependent ligase [Histoplasma capsulatum var. duboisii H88]|uniref:AMP dependent ligase n=1 Tax=Ajellomyces capsulatus (strain H88) TaxID=544711 RepID=A0A8A1LAW5_AJEC8|nr:AMP dependent ligase [Histoplasma capsulatum var. duboisii H88]
MVLTLPALSGIPTDRRNEPWTGFRQTIEITDVASIPRRAKPPILFFFKFFFGLFGFIFCDLLMRHDFAC